MSEQSAPAGFAPAAGVGLALSVSVFGFSVLMLGLVESHIVNPNALAIFIPIAMATGALGLIVGGIVEFRANNVFGGTFSLLYACFLLTTGIILKWFAPIIIDAAGAAGFGDAFGAWLLVWSVFSGGLALGTYYLNRPAFIAFVLLTLGLALLGLANVIGPDDPATFLTKLGGWVFIVDGLAAWYLGWAIAVNSVMVGPQLPLWPYPYSSRASSAAAVPPAAARV
jgi:succinate-acetate transporter protein